MDDDDSPLAGTEVHYLRSAHVGDEFKILVGHCGTTGETSLPVLYLTDANGYFGAAVDTIRSMQLARHLPPMLVVGIGYRRGDVADTIDLRARDFTPTRDGDFARVYPDIGATGGAPQFLSFVRDELTPWVSDHYPADPNRTIYFGHSLGALFGTYVLLKAPDTFTRYLLASPSYWWDHGMIFRLESDYGATNRDLTAKVFFGIGDAEDAEGRNLEAVNMPDHERAVTTEFPIDMVATMQKLVARLAARKYPGLTVASQVFDDEFHVTVGPLILSRGLRWLLDAPRTRNMDRSTSTE